MSERCDCLVLRRIRFSESSLVVTLLDRERGRFDAIAKGCRRPKSPMHGHLDLYRREECVVYPRRQGLDIVAQASLEEEWHGIGLAPRTLAAAGLLAELAGIACMPRDPHPEVFDLLVAAWSRLDGLGRADGGPPPGQAEAVAGRGLLLMLGALGFAPRLSECAGCGGPLPSGRRLGFSGERGGLLCRDCVGQGVFFVSPEAASAMRRWVGLEDGRPGAVRRPPYRETALALARYAGEVAGRPLRSASVFSAVARDERS